MICSFYFYFCNNKKKITFLDAAAALVGKSSGVDLVRAILNLWRRLRTLSSFFQVDTNDNGMLLASTCIFKPGKPRECEGGAR